MTTSILSVAIQARKSLSDPLFLQGGLVVGVVMPLAWTPAVVSMQGSPLGTNFYDMFDGTPETELIFNVQPGVIVNVSPDRCRCCTAIRFRSGTRDSPIAQAAARQFLVIVEAEGEIVQEPYPFPLDEDFEEPPA